MLPPQPKARILFAHGLRGIAALAVVASHYAQVFWLFPGTVAGLTAAPPRTPPPPGFAAWLAGALPAGFCGHFGVALFFLISGFVIPFSLLDRTGPGFAIARIFRLWPTYAVGLTLTVAAVWLSARQYGRPLPFGFGAYLVQLGFIRDLVGVPSIDGIVWTLEIEAKFYLLCLLLAPALRAARPGPVIAAATGLAAFGCALVLLPGWLARASWPYEILYGLSLSAQMITFMLIGTMLNLRHRGRLRAAPACGLIALLLALFAAQWKLGLLETQFRAGLVAYAAAFALFAAGFALRHRVHRIPRTIGWLADLSYPLYVVHGVAGYVLMRFALDAGTGPVAAILLALVSALSVAAALHWAVELPTQRLGHQLSRRRRPAALPSAA